jgi:hypothetical protein
MLLKVWPPGDAFAALVLQNYFSRSPPISYCRDWYLEEGCCFLKGYVAVRKQICCKECIGLTSALATTALLRHTRADHLVVQ